VRRLEQELMPLPTSGARSGTRRAVGAFLALLLVLMPLLARAQPAGADLLASSSFEDVRRGVESLALSGEPRAGAILSAMHDGRLYARPDKKLFIKTTDGWIDAQTGEKTADAGAPKPVRLNNNLRRTLDASLGALRLFDPDANARRTAAESLFKAREAATLPVLERAIAKETDGGALRSMQQARAAILLSASDTTEATRLSPVATLRARGDIDARAVLSTLSGQPDAVKQAADSAIAAIDWNLKLWELAQDAYYGLSLGSVLLLAAAGLAITFGVMGVINMAHGELVMLGAYTTFLVQGAIRAHAPWLFGASLFIAIPLAFLVAGAIGVAIERLLIRFLYGRPLETLLATFGLSLVLQQGVRSLFGPTNREVGTPEWMSGAVQLGGLQLTWNRLCIIIFAVLVLAALMAALRFTSLGLRMRAVTQNRRMAAAMGIRTPWVDALTFGLGSGVAGMAGVALSQIDNVSPNLGQSYIIDSFMVVVFGGVGNLWGTVVGALTLGILNKFLEPIAGAVLGKIVVLVALILFIQRRPRGLFPLRGRAVEA
jgi:urea transport system permease protein